MEVIRKEKIDFPSTLIPKCPTVPPLLGSAGGKDQRNQVSKDEAIMLFVGVCSLKHACNAISLSYNVQIIYDKSRSAGKSNFICVY